MASERERSRAPAADPPPVKHRPSPAARANRLPDLGTASAAEVLSLQRQVGNGSVRRLVQRFVGHEHESLGNATGASIDLGNGVTLTWGQVVAVAGDEFGTVEELQEAAKTDEGRRRIRVALEHDGVRGPIPASLPAATKDDRSKQESAYVTLAMENVPHFADGGDALGTWRSHHARALQAALQAGLAGDEASFQQAQTLEAFGQHFLTDMFSGGHVRTPRREIMQFYTEKAATMAPAFVNNVRTRVEAALVSQVMLQLGALRGNYTYGKAKEKVHDAVTAKLDEGLAKIGGMPGLVRYFGLGLAGAVSGSMHDRDGRLGVVVSSENHPQPWLAKGDAMLSASPESRAQAELAVVGAREQVLAARQAGARELAVEQLAPESPPAVVHFGLNSAAMDQAEEAARAAGAYLRVNPGSAVELVGHTDPLGTAAYNLGLGQRRADAVKAALLAGGAYPDQISTSSQGEASLRSADPKRYGENRRVDFVWRSREVVPDPATANQSVDPRRERAQQALDALGPPYPAVERFIPRAVPTMNEPLPEWRWGQMAPELVGDLDAWIKDMVGPQAKTLVDAVPETIKEGDFTLAPRQIVAGIVDELLRAPARTIGNLIGQQPGP